MDMTGERRIPAPRQKVWDALNDPEVLRQCIPGCESLEKTSDTDLKATAAVKIGPIATRFTGKVQLTDLDPPNSYRISGEGQGGVAGFAKGGANVRLSEDGAGTLLQYDVKAQVGGKIAQLGARLIDATSKQMADLFFDRFTAEVAGPVAPAEPVAGTADPLAPVLAPQPAVERARAKKPPALSILSMIPEQPFGFPRIAFVGAALYLIIFIMIFKSYVFG
jgi:carbon monoxide dehydrogenase subunit G